MAEDYDKRIKEAREKAKKRKFPQTFDLIVTLKNIDLKKPENRLNLEFPLPEGRGKKQKVAIIADVLATAAEKDADFVIKRADIEKLAADKKRLKEIVEGHEWFFGEAQLMPLVGRTLGTVMGPKGKMPKPLPPNANIKTFVENCQKLIKIRIRESPVIQVAIGVEAMTDDQIAKNLAATLAFLKDKLPKGPNNIRAAFIKLTMGPAIKVGL